jgi:two-component system C4-dicarboxylate transport response regulator DctD
MPDAARAEGRSAFNVATPRARVLVAEDDDDLREAVVAWLEVSGYTVTAVPTGAELLACMHDWLLGGAPAPCDAIVTDVRMPGLNGLNIVEGLLDCGWTGPLVVMSAFGDAVMRQRIGALPEVTFLAKPFNPDTLLEALAGVDPRVAHALRSKGREAG